LRDVAALDRHLVATGMALVTGAMAFGYPILGALADALARRGVRTATTFGIYAAVFIALQIPLATASTPSPLANWAAFGFFGCGTVLGYAALTQSTSTAMAGRVNAAVNLVVFLVAFLVQWAIGAVLAIDHGSLETRHSAAFVALIGLQVLGWLWFIVGHLRRVETPV
jgi:MFS family permease